MPPNSRDGPGGKNGFKCPWHNNATEQIALELKI